MDEQYVYIDSRLRTNQDSNSYTLRLDTPIYSVTQVDLVSACVPTTLKQNTFSTSDPYIFLDIEQFRSKYGVQACRSNLQTAKDTSALIYGYCGHIFCGDVASQKLLSTIAVSNTAGNVISIANTLATTGNTTTLGNTFTLGTTMTSYIYSNSSYINYTEQQYKSSVTFKQPIESVDKFTIRWVDRFNNPVVFNPPNTDHSFMLRIYTNRKKISNYDPLERPPPVPRDKHYTDIHTYLILTVLLIGIFTIIMLRNNTSPSVPVS